MQDEPAGSTRNEGLINTNLVILIPPCPTARTAPQYEALKDSYQHEDN